MVQKRMIVFVTILFMGIALQSVTAQLDKPKVEGVFGGRINTICGIALTPDTSRIFISTESANSIFYADVYANSATPVFGEFKKMPGASATDNFGGMIQELSPHEASGKLFFILQDVGLLSCHPDSVYADTVVTGNFNFVKVYDNYLFYNSGPELHFGTLNVAGLFTESSNSPITPAITVNGLVYFEIHPTNNLIYLAVPGGTLYLYKSSDPYNALSSSTTFTDIAPTTLSTAVAWHPFGIGPDGRLFWAGAGTEKAIAYSDDEVNWTEYLTPYGGTTGKNLAFGGNASSYHMYYASIYNSNNGNSGSWYGFGQPGGFETHANDGCVYVDPVNPYICYMTTDQGIGTSVDRGGTIFEINDGVEAVQVKDFDMTTYKTTAWLASKSGIRRVDNYLTTPTWTNAIFPMGDGSPYHSVAMKPDSPDTVYAGNLRLYMSTDAGNNWVRLFTPEEPPLTLSTGDVRLTSIEVCNLNPNIILIGFEAADPAKGGVFFSNDAGATWDQVLLEASSNGDDVDVWDIVFNEEAGDTVAYVGVWYSLDYPQGRSVYRLVKHLNTWLPAQDFDAAGTAVGYAITASIYDLEVSVTGDTIFAAGTDAGTNHPIAYYKVLSGTGKWTTIPTDGFPFGQDIMATAITVGRDTVYCGVDNEIYFYPPGAAKWELGYTYPVGTTINFLYFDDLLVGTDTGLYGHPASGDPASSVRKVASLNLPKAIQLDQNYPNPFNPETRISYALPQDSAVRLYIYNALGQEIRTLVNQFQTSGNYEILWNGKNNAGRQVSSGIYYYALKTENTVKMRKMILLR